MNSVFKLFHLINQIAYFDAPKTSGMEPFAFVHGVHNSRIFQSYVIKSPPWTILWFIILGIFSAENIKRLCVFMFQT